ncbi:MAG: PEP-CTERM sorting domain-containing protein [Armatimonadetes bacterium]|nr:PEP-CTERM sorting domain-containing protein [Armatimonadota bacterium]
MSFNPGTNDWWVNYQASFSPELTNNATNDNFQVWIYNSADDLIFGPAGEGVYPLSGVGGDEVFKLETNPSASITRDSIYYKDGTSSTFGAPNLWSAGTMTQDFSLLRNIPEPSSILVLLSGIAGIGGIALKRRK